MGEIKQQSLRNTVFSYLGAALGFVLIYIQPQLISASDIGLLRLLNSFSWLVAMLMPFGLGSITLRFFPKIKNDENGHHGLFALLLLLTSAGASVVATVLYLNKSAVAAYYERSPEFPEYFTEALVFAYILSLVSVYTIYSSSLYKTTFAVFLTDVFTRIGQLIVVVLYHYQFINKHALVILYISVFFLQLVLLMIYLYRSGAVSFKVNYPFFKTLDLREIMTFGALMMMTAFASLGIKFIDQLMIGHFLNADLVGIYATAVMMTVIMEIPFNSLDRIASPKISYAWSISDIPEVGKIYEMSSRYMFFIGGLLFCLLWSGLDLIFLYLPANYQVGKMAFCIVSLSSLLNLLTGVNSSVIMYSHKYFAASTFLFVLIVVGYLANYFLIEPFGITGAALATLIAIGSFNLLKYFYILLRFKMQPFSRHTVLIALAILISLALIMVIPQHWHPFWRALLGGAWTVLVFSAMNLKFNTIEEVTKVFKRFGFIKS